MKTTDINANKVSAATVVDDVTHHKQPILVKLFTGESSSPSCGLGFNVCKDNQTGAIFVNEVIKNGPAKLSGKIHPGDRLLSLKVSTACMELEDALTILSYASPYHVELCLQPATDHFRTSKKLMRMSSSPSDKVAYRDNVRSAVRRVQSAPQDTVMIPEDELAADDGHQPPNRQFPQQGRVAVRPNGALQLGANESVLEDEASASFSYATVNRKQAKPSSVEFDPNSSVVVPDAVNSRPEMTSDSAIELVSMVDRTQVEEDTGRVELRAAAKVKHVGEELDDSGGRNEDKIRNKRNNEKNSDNDAAGVADFDSNIKQVEKSNETRRSVVSRKQTRSSSGDGQFSLFTASADVHRSNGDNVTPVKTVRIEQHGTPVNKTDSNATSDIPSKSRDQQTTRSRKSQSRRTDRKAAKDGFAKKNPRLRQADDEINGQLNNSMDSFAKLKASTDDGSNRLSNYVHAAAKKCGTLPPTSGTSSTTAAATSSRKRESYPSSSHSKLNVRNANSLILPASFKDVDHQTRRDVVAQPFPASSGSAKSVELRVTEPDGDCSRVSNNAPTTADVIGSVLSDMDSNDDVRTTDDVLGQKPEVCVNGSQPLANDARTRPRSVLTSAVNFNEQPIKVQQSETRQWKPAAFVNGELYRKPKATFGKNSIANRSRGSGYAIMRRKNNDKKSSAKHLAMKTGSGQSTAQHQLTRADQATRDSSTAVNNPNVVRETIRRQCAVDVGQLTCDKHCCSCNSNVDNCLGSVASTNLQPSADEGSLLQTSAGSRNEQQSPPVDSALGRSTHVDDLPPSPSADDNETCFCSDELGDAEVKIPGTNVSGKHRQVDDHLQRTRNQPTLPASSTCDNSQSNRTLSAQMSQQAVSDTSQDAESDERNASRDSTSLLRDIQLTNGGPVCESRDYSTSRDSPANGFNNNVVFDTSHGNATGTGCQVTDGTEFEGGRLTPADVTVSRRSPANNSSCFDAKEDDIFVRSQTASANCLAVANARSSTPSERSPLRSGAETDASADKDADRQRTEDAELNGNDIVSRYSVKPEEPEDDDTERDNVTGVYRSSLGDGSVDTVPQEVSRVSQLTVVLNNSQSSADSNVDRTSRSHQQRRIINLRNQRLLGKLTTVE